MLARHFAEAGDRPRGLHYYALAGRLAAEGYANAEAARYFGLALEMAQALPGEVATAAELFLCASDSALEHSAQDAAAIANYQAMETWAAAHGDKPARLAAMAARATIYVNPNVEQNQPWAMTCRSRRWRWRASWATAAPEAEVLWNLVPVLPGRLELNQAVEAWRTGAVDRA